MNPTLENKKIAILATDGFEESELLKPKAALEEAGAEVTVVSLEPGEITSWKNGNWGGKVIVNATIKDVSAMEFDGLMLPGGVINADTLRINKQASDFVFDFAEAGKPIAAICHGAWILIETGYVKGKTLTSWPSLKTDLMNAGAIWKDEECIVDQGFITSRKPSDIPEFNLKMIREFSGSSQKSAPLPGLTGDFKEKNQKTSSQAELLRKT